MNNKALVAGGAVAIVLVALSILSLSLRTPAPGPTDMTQAQEEKELLEGRAFVVNELASDGESRSAAVIERRQKVIDTLTQ